MRFGYTADIHLSRYGQDKTEEQTNLPERLHSIKTSMNNIAQYCVNNDIDNLIIGGDTLHGKSIIYAIAQDIMLDFFNEWKDVLNCIVIDGNHDLSGKGHQVVSALRPLKNTPGVTWVPFDETLRIENMFLVPYGPNMVDTIKKNEADILISHFGLNEGILNSGISVVSDISLRNLIKKYKLVLLGHYHKPQEIIRDDIQLYYVGSPIQLDWGEKNDIKRFLVVDSETFQVTSIPTEGYRKHIEVDITYQNKEEILENARKAKQEGHYVKINKREVFDLEVEEGLIVIDKIEQDITNRGITSSMSHSDKFKKFLEIKEISEEQQELYLFKALELIERQEG